MGKIRLKKKPTKKRIVLKPKSKFSISEIQKRKRINVALWAYAYEFHDNPIVDDGKFDSVCAEVDLDIDTDNKKMDRWFRKNFSPDTGQWIHDHPCIKGIKKIYERLTSYSQ